MTPAPPPREPATAVATVLAPNERPRVDAAGAGLYRAIHRDSMDDVIRELRERPISAVLVSVARCDSLDVSRITSLVREFPRIPAVALLTQLEPSTAQAVLALGRSGVRQVIDVRQPAGWHELRTALMTTRGDAMQRSALARLSVDLAGAPADCCRFFEALFDTPARTGTVRELARDLGVLPSTLMSRFFRARLPAPKRYLAMARLTRAAWLFENPGLSVANVANHLDYSSPQSFGRHVRTMLAMTAVEFRTRYDGEGMLERFRAELVLPYLERLRRFTPLSGPPGWVPDPRPSDRSRPPTSGSAAPA